MKGARGIRLTATLAVAAALVIVATALAATAVAGENPGTRSSAADEVRAAERALLRATVDANIPAARRLLADDLQLIDPLGGAETKEQYLGSIASGAPDFLAFEPASAIEVHLYGHAAVARFRSSVEVVAFGDRLKHQAWHTDLWERQHGDDWKLVRAQTTAVPNNPALVIEALKPRAS